MYRPPKSLIGFVAVLSILGYYFFTPRSSVEGEPIPTPTLTPDQVRTYAVICTAGIKDLIEANKAHQVSGNFMNLSTSELIMEPLPEAVDSCVEGLAEGAEVYLPDGQLIPPKPDKSKYPSTTYSIVDHATINMVENGVARPEQRADLNQFLAAAVARFRDAQENSPK